MKAAVVVTTINDCGELVSALHKNLETYGHLEDTTLIIVPDLKTPTPSWLLDEFPGLQCIWFDLKEQDNFIESLGVKTDFIRRNSDHRRNVGYLQALAEEYDFVISLDDDNYPMPNYDFFGYHSVVCQDMGYYKTSLDTWYNVCDMLVIDDYPKHYARGFPYFARFRETLETKITKLDADAIVRVNEGLWESEPDFDAITWVAAPTRSSAVVGNVVLGKDCWAPVNSQNTAVHRDLIPAYYFCRSSRYGDIMQGYIVQAVAKAIGWSVKFGSPVVDHRRNSHNHLRDLEADITDIQIFEKLLPELVTWQLKGSTISDLYMDMSERLRAHGLMYVADDMNTWTKMCKQIGVTV